MNKINKKIFLIIISFFITLNLSAEEEKYCDSLSDCRQKGFYIYSKDKYKHENSLLKIFILKKETKHNKLYVACHFSININDGIYNSAACKNL